MQRTRAFRLTAWVLCALVCAWSLFAAANTVMGRAQDGRPLRLLGDAVVALAPILFMIPATLIILRHPRHAIGWLLMVAVINAVLSDAMTRYLATFQVAPPPTFPNLFMMWYANASWLGAIFPILLLPLFFPTGRLPSPRWRWVVSLAVGMTLFFVILSAFDETFQLDAVDWTLQNPIGIHLIDQAWTVILIPWAALLVMLTVASLASVVVRYRRAMAVEREQMKWLLFASAVFGLVYLLNVALNFQETPPSLILLDIGNVLGNLAVAAIPIAIAMAILRYHLFDIDVIIRLTITYVIVTGLLGLAYVGGVILLQAVLRLLTGQGSDIAVVATTLAAAVLFTPLRRRIQAVIDRRFYRQKYNAEQALAQFAAAARAGSDLEVLKEMLEQVVRENLQPAQVKLELWLKGDPRR